MARICCCIGVDSSQSILEGVELCERFYKDIYKVFLEVGDREEIEFLAFTLCALDPFNPLFYEDWPHRLDVSHSAPFDKFYHGILSLKGTRFMPIRKRRRSSLNHSSMNTSEAVFQVAAL